MNPAFSRKGDAFRPNTTQQKQYTTTLLEGSRRSSTHTNLRESLSALSTYMFRNAFSVSPIKSIRLSLNLNTMSYNIGLKEGSLCRQSFRQVPPLRDFADTSYTTLSFVVLVIMRSTASYNISRLKIPQIICSHKRLNLSLLPISVNIRVVCALNAGNSYTQSPDAYSELAIF